MTKTEFLQTLERELRNLTESEREEILYDFEEHFAVGLEKGKEESEIAKDLGDPNVIAKELLMDYRIAQAETDKSMKNLFRAIAAAVSLSVFNLIFVFGPAFLVFSVFFGLSAAALVLVFSPLLWLISALLEPINVFSSFFASIFFCGVGLLMSVGVYYFGKFLYEWLLKYLKFNLRMVKGEN